MKLSTKILLGQVGRLMLVGYQSPSMLGKARQSGEVGRSCLGYLPNLVRYLLGRQHSCPRRVECFIQNDGRRLGGTRSLATRIVRYCASMLLQHLTLLVSAAARPCPCSGSKHAEGQSCCDSNAETVCATSSLVFPCIPICDMPPMAYRRLVALRQRRSRPDP